MADVTGTDSGETLGGTSGNDTITALGGDDTIMLTVGVDTVDGGTGIDQMSATPGALFLPAGPHSYTVTANRITDGSGMLDTSFVNVERVNISDTNALAVDASGFAGDLFVAAGTAFSGPVNNDSVIGGSGNDAYISYRGGLDTFEGGVGIDAAFYGISEFSPVTFSHEGDAILLDAGENQQLRATDTELLGVFVLGGGPLYADASSITAQVTFGLTQSADLVVGSGGADTFLANANSGDDILAGLGGADLYRFSTFDGLRGVTILDLEMGDRLDLSMVSGAKSFIGTAAFSGVAGQYRVSAFQGETRVIVDTNGDMQADATLTLANDTFTLGETAAGSNILEITAILPPPDPGDSTIDGGASDDQLEGGDGDDTINGNGGNDQLYGDEDDDSLNGGAGQDALYGEEGNDHLFDSGAEQNFLFGGDGDDTINYPVGGTSLPNQAFLRGGFGNDVITAANGIFWINGDGEDTIDGDGDDVITLTNSRTDTMFNMGSFVQGGAGDDTIRVSGIGLIQVIGGTGADDISIAGFTTAMVSTEWGVFDPMQIDYSDNVVHLLASQLTLVLEGAQDQVEIETTTGQIRATIFNFNAGEAGDRIDLSVYGADPFGSGALTIGEVTENSTLFTLIQHAASGSAFRIAGPARELSTFNLGVANPLYNPGPGLVLDQPTYGDPTYPVRRVGRDGNDTLLGFDNNDTLLGAGGHDLLRGGAGRDLLEGGTGNDWLEGGADDDTIDGGADADRLFGNDGDDALDGGAGLDQLAGGDGNDALHGGADADKLFGDVGRDRLDGGAGADELDGGKGDDVYVVDEAGDKVIEANGRGNDGVESWIGYTLAANVENLTLLGAAALAGAGNALNNWIAGNSGANLLGGGDGNDRLDGALGADTMKGGLGDDVFAVDDAGDKVQEKAGEGTDLVESSISWTLSNDVELLRLTGAAANGTGNGLANTLYGNNLANRLDGLAGADRMEGANGDDVYVVDDAGDQVIEAAGKGNDSVESSLGYTLTANVENLTLTGSAAIGGAGNALNNRIIGNSGANTLGGGDGNDRLDGGLGADMMKGGLGDDVFVVEDAGDKVQEKVGEGTDSVEAWIDHALASEVEVLRLMGAGNLGGWGNGLDNTLIGNGGDNALHGGLGADRLTGGSGADGFWFETALGTTNIDVVTDFNMPADTIYLDRTIFAGIAANGALAAGALRIGTAAVDAEDRILYDSATGNLWYDADGVGGAAAVQFARLDAGLSLTNADFVAVA